MEFKYYKIPWEPARHKEPLYCMDVYQETMELVVELAYGDYSDEEIEGALTEIAEFMKILSSSQKEAYADIVEKISFFLGNSFLDKVLMFPPQMGALTLKRGHYDYQ